MDGSAYCVDCSVRSSVRKKPGLTMVVVMPNGATSGCSDSIQPSRPNFDAAYAEQNSKPTRPAAEEIEIMCPERCLLMTGRTTRGTYHEPMSIAANWRSICTCVSS